MAFQGTCASSRTSTAARRGSVVAGGHHTATVCSRRSRKDRGWRSIGTDLSPHAGRRRVNDKGLQQRLRQSTGSWFVVEYGSQALHHIGIVLGPTSGAKGTVPLTKHTRAAARSRVSKRGKFSLGPRTENSTASLPPWFPPWFPLARVETRFPPWFPPLGWKHCSCSRQLTGVSSQMHVVSRDRYSRL